jgi:hypothetical protein
MMRYLLIEAAQVQKTRKKSGGQHEQSHLDASSCGVSGVFWLLSRGMKSI